MNLAARLEPRELVWGKLLGVLGAAREIVVLPLVACGALVALGHLRALERIGELPGVTTLNLGTGRGYSVLEMVRAFEAASGRPVPFDIVARRPGDIAACWADPAHAERVLGWRAQRDLQAMCEDAWRWQSGNPRGYASA